MGDAELEKGTRQTGRRPEAGLLLILITVGPGIDGPKRPGDPTNAAHIVDTPGLITMHHLSAAEGVPPPRRCLHERCMRKDVPH